MSKHTPRTAADSAGLLLSRDGQQLRLASHLSAKIPEIRPRCLEFAGGPEAGGEARPTWFDLLANVRPPELSLAAGDTSAHRDDPPKVASDTVDKPTGDTAASHP